MFLKAPSLVCAFLLCVSLPLQSHSLLPVVRYERKTKIITRPQEEVATKHHRTTTGISPLSSIKASFTTTTSRHATAINHHHHNAMRNAVGPTTSNTPRIHRVVTVFLLRKHQQQPAASSDENKNENDSEEHHDTVQVAIFHRCDTMPSFPSHWAGISGTIERNETPLHAAQRELEEETNLSRNVIVTLFGGETTSAEAQQSQQQRGGLYVNVPIPSSTTTITTTSGKQQQTQRPHKVIRVYPFAIELPSTSTSTSSSTTTLQPPFELRGTEHDRYQFVTLRELEVLESKHQCVPGLLQAFHHATFGKYDTHIDPHIRVWASDTQNGASIMVHKALQLLQKQRQEEEEEEADSTRLCQMAMDIAMLRPTMVPMVNVMRQFLDVVTTSPSTTMNESYLPDKTQQGHAEIETLINSISDEIQQCITMGQDAIRSLHTSSSLAATLAAASSSLSPPPNLSSPSSSLRIVTFSRSGTIVKILHPLLLTSSSRSSPMTAKVVHDKQDNEESSQQPLPPKRPILYCHHVICGKSSPGEEGLLMAQDLQQQVDAAFGSSNSSRNSCNNNDDDDATTRNAKVECVTDEELHQLLISSSTSNAFDEDDNNQSKDRIDLVLIGADCILLQGQEVEKKRDDSCGDDATVTAKCVINKVGTTQLCQLAQRSNIPVYCVADRWKIWDDVFPPPIETDLFEIVPANVIDRIIVPPPSHSHSSII